MTSADLLKQRRRIEALARRLVKDVHRAEDLAQDTWLAALQQAPKGVRSPAYWLGGVLRNLVRQRAREDGRRADREQIAAAPEVDDAEGRLRRFGALRSVVDELYALAEPFRGTLLMRFFDELPPR